jgi:hypothetical protein
MISAVGSAPFAILEALSAGCVLAFGAVVALDESPPRQNANTAIPITATAMTARSSGFGPDFDWAGTGGGVV